MNIRSNFPTKHSVIASFVLSFSMPSYAAMVRGDIDFQYFRDFAENKGAFHVGAMNIPVFNHSGQRVGTMLPNVPMPDLSAVERTNAVATAAVHHQYITSVAHNSGYGSASFGQAGNNPDQHAFNYLIVDRNNYDRNDRDKDYHVPRLHKFITEIEPFATTTTSNPQTLLNRNRYPQAVRLGSGLQVTNQNGHLTTLHDPYAFRTGGNPLNLEGHREHWIESYNSSLTHGIYGPMPTYAMPGDSGSPLFLFDKAQNRWLLAGVVKTYAGDNYLKNIYVLSRPDYIQTKINEDRGSILNNRQAGMVYNWRAVGKSSQLVNNRWQKYTVHLADPQLANLDTSKERPSLNHGKHLQINGQRAVVRLQNNINQGAGGLYFYADALVEPMQDQSWQGAGVYVHQGKTVHWRVKNPKNDRLSKIGQGTLYVDGKGENKGDLSLGQGLVVLDYKADRSGKKQAFHQVGIVSGRGTLRLASADQINPNKLYFGFRGGRLDLNGNALSFNYIQNTDDGAMIVNHNLNKTASVTHSNPEHESIFAFNGYFGETNSQLPNGKLNVRFNPHNTQSKWLLSGGTALNGEFQVDGGSVILSGKPTAYAYDYLKQQDVVKDDDWVNRHFRAQKFVVNQQGNLYVGRNVSHITGDFIANQAGQIEIGFRQGQTPICQRSDHTGQTYCETKTLSTAIFNALPTTHATGNVQLNQQGRLILGKAHLTGQIQGQKESRIILDNHSHWTLTDHSRIGHLSLNLGEVSLSQGDGSSGYHRLVIDGNLFGNGKFHYRTNAEAGLGDHVQVNGIAQGKYLLSLQNTGKEPHQVSPLSLMTLTHPQQTRNNLTVMLEGGYVDLGAYRYILANRQNDYRLYSPVRDAELSPHNPSNPTFLQLEQAKKEAAKYQQQLDKLNAQLAKKHNELAQSQKEATGMHAQISRLHKALSSINRHWNWSARKKAREAAKYRSQLGKASAKLRAIQAAQQTIRRAEQQVAHSIQQNKKAQATTNKRLTGLQQSLKNTVGDQAYRLCLKEQGQDVCRHINISANESPQALLDKFVYQIGLIDELSSMVADFSAEQTAFNADPNVSEQEKAQFAQKLGELKAKLAQAQQEEESLQHAITQSVDSSTITRYLATLTPTQQPTVAQKFGISRYSNTAISELSAQMNALMHTHRNVVREMLKPKMGSWNLWANSEKIASRHYANDYRDYQHRQSINQLGIETKLNDHQHLGAIFSHSEITNHFDEKAENKGQLRQGTLYLKSQLPAEMVWNLSAGVGKAKNNLQLDQHKTSFHRHFYTLGTDLAKGWTLSQWQINTLLGLNYHRIEQPNYRLEQSEIQLDDLNIVQSHFGINLARTLQFGEFTLQPTATLDYSRTLNRRLQTRVNQHRFSQKADNALHTQVGLALSYRQWQLSSHIGLRSGKQIRQQKYAGIQIGYHW